MILAINVGCTRYQWGSHPDGICRSRCDAYDFNDNQPDGHDFFEPRASDSSFSLSQLSPGLRHCGKVGLLLPPTTLGLCPRRNATWRRI